MLFYIILVFTHLNPQSDHVFRPASTTSTTWKSASRTSRPTAVPTPQLHPHLPPPQNSLPKLAQTLSCTKLPNALPLPHTTPPPPLSTLQRSCPRTHIFMTHPPHFLLARGCPLSTHFQRLPLSCPVQPWVLPTPLWTNFRTSKALITKHQLPC
jgi:hypothetical protein